MDDNEIIETHRIFDYILHVNDGFLWQDVLRSIGGGLVITLTWLNTLLEEIVAKIITFNDFYSTGAMGEFMEVARPLIWGVFFIALLVLGFQFITNKIERRNEVLLNVILAVCFIVVIPDLMSKMGEVLNIGINHMNPESETLAGNVIKSNVADVLYYAENDFQFSSSKRGDDGLPPRPANREESSIGTTDFTYANRLSNSSALRIPYLQKLDLHADDGWIFKEDWVKELSDEAKEVLKTKSMPTGVGEGYQVEEMEKNAIPMTKIGRETYYRYHVNWLPLIATLLITTIALGISIIKIGRAVFDLAFHQIFGMFVAASDLTGGQRTKKVIIEIMNTYVVIFIMMLLLQVFMMFTTWANGLKGEIGTFGLILLLIAGAWAVIDAPDIIQRQLGIDAGLRSGWQSLMGAYAATKAVGAAGKGAVNAGKGIKDKMLGSSEKDGFNKSQSNIVKSPVKDMNGKPSEEKNNLKQGSKASVPTMPGSGELNEGVATSNQSQSSLSDLDKASTIAATMDEMGDTALEKENITPVPPTPNTNQPVNTKGNGNENEKVTPTSNISSQKANTPSQNKSQQTGKGNTSEGTNSTGKGAITGFTESGQSITPMPSMSASESSENKDLQTPIQRQETTPIPATSSSQGGEAVISPSSKQGVNKGSQQTAKPVPGEKVGKKAGQMANKNVQMGSQTAKQAAVTPTTGGTIQDSRQSVAPVPGESVNKKGGQVTKKDVQIGNQVAKQAPVTSTTGGTTKDSQQSAKPIPAKTVDVQGASQASAKQHHVSIGNSSQSNIGQSTTSSTSVSTGNGNNLVKTTTQSQQTVTVTKNNATTPQNQTDSSGSSSTNRSVHKLKSDIENISNNGLSLGQNIRRYNNKNDQGSDS